MLDQSLKIDGSRNPLANDQPRWRTWRELTLLMLMIMEVCWVVPWFRSLTPATFSAGTPKAFFIFLALILAAHLFIRLFNYLRLKIVLRQSLMVLFLIFSILIGYKYLLYPSETEILALLNRPIRSFADWGTLIPDEFIVAIAVILGWWRGISFAQVHIGPHLVMNNFILGIIMFFVYGFINTMVTGETPGVLLYIFVFTSLLAMSSSRMFIIHSLRGGEAGVFDRRWFVGISFAAFIVVFIASLTSSLLNQESGIVGLLITGSLYVVSLLIFILFFPILLLLIGIFENVPLELKAIDELLGSLNNLRTMMQDALNNLGDLVNLSGLAEVIADWGSDIKALIFWGILILAIGGVVVLISLQLWKDRNRRILAEDQQSILDDEDLWKLLRSALEGKLKGIWGNLINLSVFSDRRRLYAAERVRQIYIEMMDICQKLGTQRPDAATPIEFMPKIMELFPKYDEEIEVITLAYNRIRYGQLPEKKSEIIVIENAWSRLEQEGRILIESKKKIKKPPEMVPGGSS
jgi:hypothetical protein